MKKVYVTVYAMFDPEGHIRPLRVIWKDGKKFDVDQVFDIRPAASLKAGGAGIRYTCGIRGKACYLFLEGNRWFVEAKCS
ncbi:MAG: hypothetical protein ACI4PM_01490 [Butyricicoccus sp.]